MKKISLHSGDKGIELRDNISDFFKKNDYEINIESGVTSKFCEEWYIFVFILTSEDSVKKIEELEKQANIVIDFSKKKRRPICFIINEDYKINENYSDKSIFRYKEEVSIEEIGQFIRTTYLNEYLQSIEKRFELANIDYEKTDRHFKVKIPSSRDIDECNFRINENDLELLNESNIEDYRYISGYEAIWSKKHKIIECLISMNGPTFRITRLLEQYLKAEDEIENEDGIEQESEITEHKAFKQIEFPFKGDIKVEFGDCSLELMTLSFKRDDNYFPFNNLRERRRPSIKISNISIDKHDESLNVLQKIANSIFFQIDLVLESSFFLEPKREAYSERRKRTKRRKATISDNTKLDCPKFQYDTEPMSLYWDAKSNQDKPLFKFLSFYQVLEYYYPIYSSIETKKKVQAHLKNPRFDANRDNDISKLLDLVKLNFSGKSYGSEREQLKATLKNATDNDELREFFTLDSDRKKFYEDNKTKNFINQKISIKNAKSDLVEEVSERIYEIRNKIVHSKATEDDFEIILPFSDNVKKIGYDIELVEFISRKLLIVNSENLIIKA